MEATSVRAVGTTRDGAAEAVEAAIDDDLGDELLGLIFAACHPMLSPDARAERDRLELALFELRDRKSQLSAAEYFAQLEALLVQIAEIYEKAGALE